jgi:hypothetical protein
MQHYTSVPDTRVFNTRLYVRPVTGLELGASRFIQWGGKGQGNGLGSLWRAFSGRANDPNAPANNEIAGFDARYSFPLWGNPVTLYGQFVGEDEASLMPSKYLGLVGAQYKHMWGTSRLQWHAEAADTTADRLFGLGSGITRVAYAHSTYRDGLYQDGLPIGHFIGGDGRVYSAGVTLIPSDYKYYSRYSFRLFQANVNATSHAINQAFPRQNRFVGAELAASWMLKPATFRAGVMGLRNSGGRNDFGVILSLDLPLDSK